jgi:Tol biopolymer transport system component
MNYVGHPAWTADGREIIFPAGPVFSPSLWRMTVAGPGKPRRLASVGEGGIHPALSRDGRRLIYTRFSFDTDIYKIEVPAGEATGRNATQLISSSRQERHPDFSPDGGKIAFLSDRSGTGEIWVCDSDGSKPFQATSFGGPATGVARWSPDGKSIATVAPLEGHEDIFIVPASGGKARRLTTNPAHDNMPYWSRDGRWIYFHSDRTGRAEVWKLPAAETTLPEKPVQVTRSGGSHPQESPDGELVYYYRSNAIWQVPVEGGEETLVTGSVRSGLGFEATANGIYFIARDEPALELFDYSTRASRTVAALSRSLHGDLAIAPNGRTILYSQQGPFASDLMLVENFR